MKKTILISSLIVGGVITNIFAGQALQLKARREHQRHLHNAKDIELTFEAMNRKNKSGYEIDIYEACIVGMQFDAEYCDYLIENRYI